MLPKIASFDGSSGRRPGCWAARATIWCVTAVWLGDRPTIGRFQPLPRCPSSRRPFEVMQQAADSPNPPPSSTRTLHFKY